MIEQMKESQSRFYWKEKVMKLDESIIKLHSKDFHWTCSWEFGNSLGNKVGETEVEKDSYSLWN